MPPQLVLFVGIGAIAWLFYRDRKLRPMTSGALWIPLIWLAIIGSRSLSVWFGETSTMDTPSEYVEGNAFDRNIFLALILIGVFLLLRRRICWRHFFESNRWLWILFSYWAISTLWSDFPFVSFKRWIKDLGNLVMVMIMLTESDPIAAVKAVFARYIYFAVLLSVVFIKYFPLLGRYYNRWTGQATFCGISTEKNTLGSVILVCGIFLAWDLIQMYSARNQPSDRADKIVRISLLVMTFWLFSIVDSSTAMACMILGVALIALARIPAMRKQFKNLGTWSLAFGGLLFLLNLFPAILQAVVGLLGRDATFTGRTDIWAILLKEPINPILGTGYQSFWLGSGAQRLWEIYYFHPNQAHNGYLDTYMNGGIIALLLLTAFIVSTGRRVKELLPTESHWGALRFAFFVVVIFYSWTESIFNILSPIWFVFLVVSLEYDAVLESANEDVSVWNQIFSRSQGELRTNGSMAEAK